MMLRLLPLMLVTSLVAGCGLKGPLYDPDKPRESDEYSTSETNKDKDKRPRPAPQSQKEDRERADAPAQDTNQPAAPLDPDRPQTNTPPSGL